MATVIVTIIGEYEIDDASLTRDYDVDNLEEALGIDYTNLMENGADIEDFFPIGDANSVTFHIKDTDIKYPV